MRGFDLGLIMKLIYQLVTGVTTFCLFSYGMWAFGDYIGVGTAYDLVLFSFFSGAVMHYLAFKTIILRNSGYRVTFKPTSLLMAINGVLGGLLYFSIMGAAMLVSGKLIFTEGLISYFSHLFLPPLFLCFIPTLLMRWKIKDGDIMVISIAELTAFFGLRFVKC